jgi:glycosyltransferase involved in cell wall biosynthesis
MNKIKDTAVIVPAYNEEISIEKTIKNIKKYFEFIVVIDDCSTDDTSLIAKENGATVIKHPINLGAGAATQTGIDYILQNITNIKYFATFDADGQHNIIDLVKMRDAIIKRNDDIIIGSRFLGNVKNIKLTKKILLKMGIRFSNLTSKTHFTDTHNGIRIFNKKVAKTIKLQEPRYQFCSEIIEKIHKNKYKYSEFPVSIIYTKHSSAKGQKGINAINIAFDTILNKFIK